MEQEIAELSDHLDVNRACELGLPWRFMLVKLLEDDPYLLDEVGRRHPDCVALVRHRQQILAESHGRPPETVISSERHALSVNVFEQVAKVKPATKPDWRKRLDQHRHPPVLGLRAAAADPEPLFPGGLPGRPIPWRIILPPTWTWPKRLGQAWLGSHTLAYTLTEGLLMGIFGGVAIVLPYLLPFLIGLAVLEDSGYLPRVAFLMDNLMHLLGLHGKSIIPFILGYGCSVPSVMSTRILESPRDRLVVAMLAILIPCSARSVIIFALVAYALGPYWALGVYFFNLVVIALLGRAVHLHSARGFAGPAHGDSRVPPARP